MDAERHDEESRERASRPRTRVMGEAGGRIDPGGPASLPEFAAVRRASLEAQAGGQRYVELGEVARGGMGTVLQVWDTVLHRPLAMKVLEAEETEEGSGGSTRNATRFLREARVTGQLSHPGVVPIHDLEIDDEGRVAFTMELIEGMTLADVIDRVHAEDGDEEWTLARAVLAVLKVCEVMSYSHSRGVIHRDLKPSNVMVGPFGEIFVVDWGLAKVKGRPEPDEPRTAEGRRVVDLEDAGRTVDGTIFGTPAYMSPEQARGDVAHVTELADVYSAGAILYHLLTGRKPYSTTYEAESEDVLELVRRGPPTPIQRLARRAPPELVAVCEKAMARAPEERYGSMAALAADLRAFLEQRVVAAYEQGFWAEAKKVVRRNRGTATSVAAAVLVALVAMVTVTWVHAELNDRLETRNAELRLAREEALENAARARRMAEEAEQGRREAERRRYLANVTTAAMSADAGAVRAAQRRLEDVPEERRGWEWHHLSLRADGSVARWAPAGVEGESPLASPLAIDVSDRTGHVLVGTSEGILSLQEGGDGSIVRSWRGHEGAVLGVSVGGGSAATVGANGVLAFWDLESGEAHFEVQPEQGVTCVALGGSDAVPVSGHPDGRVLAWSREGESRSLARFDGSVACVALDPRGERVAVGTKAGTVHVLDASEGEILGELPDLGFPVTRLAFDSTGHYLAGGGEHGGLWIWEATTLGLVQSSRHTHGVSALAATGGPARFAVGYEDGHLETRDTEGAVTSFPGLQDAVTGVCSDSSGARLLTSSADGSVHLWDSRGPAAETRIPTYDLHVRALAFTPDGSSLAVASVDGHVLYHDALTGRLTAKWSADSGVTALVHLDSDEIAAATLGGRVEVWDPDSASGSARVLTEGQDDVLALVEAGDRLVAAGSDGVLRVWSAGGEELERELRGHEGPVVALAADPSGRRVASSSTDGSVRVWSLDGDSGTELEASPDTTASALAFRPDGKALAWGEEDGRIVELPLDGSEKRTLVGHGGAVHALAWSPDGSRLASGSEDGTVRVWAAGLDEPVLVDRGHGAAVHAVAFDPDGKRLATASAARGVRILESGGVEERFEAHLAERERGANTWERVWKALGETDPRPTRLTDLPESAGLEEDEARFARELAIARGFRARRLRQRAWDAVFSTDDHQRALVLAREAALLAPDEASSRTLLGAAYVRNKMDQHAVEALRDLPQELEPRERVFARAFLAIAMCRLGYVEEATKIETSLQEELEQAEGGLGERPAEVMQELAGCLRGDVR